MKIFHTGDWHIGKLVNQVYMTEDQFRNETCNRLPRLKAHLESGRLDDKLRWRS